MNTPIAYGIKGQERKREIYNHRLSRYLIVFNDFCDGRDTLNHLLARVDKLREIKAPKCQKAGQGK